MVGAELNPNLYDRLKSVAPHFKELSLEQILTSVNKIIRDRQSLEVGGSAEDYDKLTAELIKYTTIFRAPESYISEARNNFGGWLYRSLDYVDSLKTNATDPIKVKKLKINVFKAFIARFNQLLNYGTRQQIREADKPIYDEAQLQLTKASPAFRQVYQDTQQPL